MSDTPATRLAMIERLHRGELDALVLRGDTVDDSAHSVQVVLPGAFNPLHEGHRKMARVAAASLGVPVTFELSIVNVDKPPLDIDSINLRLAQFDPGHTVCLTRAATFAEKVQLFDNAGFVVGADTILRIAEARYYGDDILRRDLAVATIVEAGARFLVFGRTNHGRFQTLGDLDLPRPLRAICREVREEDFRHDISSTEIRGVDSASE